MPLTVLKENIIKRFNELKPFHSAASNRMNGSSALNGKSTLNGNVVKKRNGMNAPALKKRRIA